MTRRVLMPSGPEALAQEGLSPTPEQWEDGLRMDTGPGSIEWWYFDARFEDGSTAVIIFLTKPLMERGSTLKPGVHLTITRPDGKRISQGILIPPNQFSASKERCYVRAGESWARGDLHRYEVHAKVGEMTAQLTFTGVVPAWRPGVGKNYYNADHTQFFGWLPAIPFGTCEGFLTYDGKMRAVKGTCYHDHNWSNVGLNEVMSHWYWGRAHIGEYTLIFVEMTASEAFGSQKMPVFLLARGSQILTGDGEPLCLETDNFIQHPGGRSYPTSLNFHWRQNNGKNLNHIHLALRNPAIIEATSLLTYLPPWKRLLARLVANPYYFRFNADLDLSINLGGLRVRQKGQALYELMLLK